MKSLRNYPCLRENLDTHIRVDDERNADLFRTRILQFNNELLRDILHTREDFIEILAVIDDYEHYCETMRTIRTTEPPSPSKISSEYIRTGS